MARESQSRIDRNYLHRQLMGRNSRTREVATKAILELLQPLMQFAMDAGLSASEVNQLVRCAAVRNVAQEQLARQSRVNISGVSATTGISRAEVSRVLNSPSTDQHDLVERKQNSIGQVLAAWHSEPRFTNDRGLPADLPMYGKGASFEALIRDFGRGIPPRAVLDELIRTNAIEILESQMVRAKTALPIERGMSSSAIKAFGVQGTAILETMLSNMRCCDNPQFIATVVSLTVPPSELLVLKKEIRSKGANLLGELQESFIQSSKLASRKKGSKAISVTVFCNEREIGTSRFKLAKRRNFRRR